MPRQAQQACSLQPGRLQPGCSVTSCQALLASSSAIMGIMFTTQRIAHESTDAWAPRVVRQHCQGLTCRLLGTSGSSNPSMGAGDLLQGAQCAGSKDGTQPCCMLTHAFFKVYAASAIMCCCHCTCLGVSCTLQGCIVLQQPGAKTDSTEALFDNRTRTLLKNGSLFTSTGQLYLWAERAGSAAYNP